MNFADPVERLLFLQQLPLLRGLASHRVALLAEAAEECILQEGDSLIAEGDPRDSFFAAARGRYRLLFEGRPVWDAEAPVLLGLFEALADDRRTRIIALEPGLALRIPRAALRDLVEDAFDVVEHLLREAGEMLALQDWLEVSRLLATRPSVHRELPGGKNWNSFVARLSALRAAPVLRSFDFDSLGHLARRGVVAQLSPQTVWQSGDLGSHFYVVLEGRPPTGGILVGFLEALAEAPRFHDFVVEDGMTVMRFDRDMLFDVLEDHPTSAFALLSTFATLVIELFVARDHLRLHAAEELRDPGDR
jgi:CRP-like cAMP-binding protein